MPQYSYRAKKGPHEVIEGSVEATSEKEAIEKINSMGYIPVHISLRQGGASEDSVVRKPLGGKVKPREVTIFSRELASLLKSGVPILRAIAIIQEQSESLTFRNIMVSIHSGLKDGGSFSSVLANYPAVFSSLYIALVRTGEDSGALADALFRVAEYRGKQEEMISRLRMALAYPVLMCVVGAGTIVFMLTFAMPRLTGIFLSLGQNLPLPTRVLLSVSKVLQQWWIWVVFVSIVFLLSRQLHRKAAKFFLSRTQLCLPLFGQLVLKSDLARFSRTLELLIKSGIPILKAIDIAAPVINNDIIRVKIQESHRDLEQGGSFGQSLKSSKLLPSFVTNLITVGEESGRLTDALSEIATSYERDTDEAIKIMTNLLEPLMILIMGLLVGFIVVAMLLPVFEINVMAR